MASKESTLMIFSGYFTFLDSSKQIAIHMAWMLIQCRSNSHGQNVRDDFYVLYILVYLIWDGAIIVNFFLILKGPVRDMYKVKAIKTTGIIILNTVSQRTQIVKHYCLHLNGYILGYYTRLIFIWKYSCLMSGTIKILIQNIKEYIRGIKCTKLCVLNFWACHLQLFLLIFNIA